jgi:hypothetical protein
MGLRPLVEDSRHSGKQEKAETRVQKSKNIQQPKVWPTSPSAHRLVVGDSPLYSGRLQLLQAASGGSSPT